MSTPLAFILRLRTPRGIGQRREKTVRVVISYDIASDEKRRKMAALLENILPRVQYSVFEGEVPDEVIPTTVKKALPLLDPETDSLRVYRLCASCAGKVDVYGKKLLTDAGPVRVL